MAIDFLRTRTGKANKKAAGRAVRYISGLDSYSNKQEIQFIKDGNLPLWASNAVEFFDQSDALERKNGRSYRSVIVAIPRECSDSKTWALIFVNELLGDNCAYRLAIHKDPVNHNPHIHLMFSERGAKFGLDPSKTQKDYFSRLNPKLEMFGTSKKEASAEWLVKAKEIFQRCVRQIVGLDNWQPFEKSGQVHEGPIIRNASNWKLAQRQALVDKNNAIRQRNLLRNSMRTQHHLKTHAIPLPFTLNQGWKASGRLNQQKAVKRVFASPKPF